MRSVSPMMKFCHYVSVSLIQRSRYERSFIEMERNTGEALYEAISFLSKSQS